MKRLPPRSKRGTGQKSEKLSWTRRVDKNGRGRGGGSCRRRGGGEMAALSFSSLALPPSQSRKVLASASYNGALKPIVVRGDPPTFVSAPGRRIVAGEDSSPEVFFTPPVALAVVQRGFWCSGSLAVLPLRNREFHFCGMGTMGGRVNLYFSSPNVLHRFVFFLHFRMMLENHSAPFFSC